MYTRFIFEFFFIGRVLFPPKFGSKSVFEEKQNAMEKSECDENVVQKVSLKAFILFSKSDWCAVFLLSAHFT